MEVSPFAIVHLGTKIFVRCSEVSVNGGSTVLRGITKLRRVTYELRKENKYKT